MILMPVHWSVVNIGDPVPGINTPRLDTVCCQGAETLTGLVSSITSLTTISGWLSPVRRSPPSPSPSPHQILILSPWHPADQHACVSHDPSSRDHVTWRLSHFVCVSGAVHLGYPDSEPSASQSPVHPFTISCLWEMPCFHPPTQADPWPSFQS